MEKFDLDDFINLTSSWEFLKATDLPIFIYGMGDGALKILNRFDEFNITCAGFFASDEFVRGHYFQGHLVHKLSEIEKYFDEFVIVLAFAAGYERLIKSVKELNHSHIFLAPDLPVYGDLLFTKDYLKNNFNEFSQVYDLLGDEKSKILYKNVIKFKITGKIEYLLDNYTSVEESYNDILKLHSEEKYVDLGAYNGDTVKEFVDFTNNSYSSIIAVEPDTKNYKKLMKTVENIDKIDLYNVAIWENDCELNFSNLSGRNSYIGNKKNEVKNQKNILAKSLDNILNGEGATYIKFDVEGAEYQALLGGVNTIKNFSPKLKIALYHRSEDMINIPLLLKKINPKYKFFLRQYPYIPAWEVNLYAII